MVMGAGQASGSGAAAASDDQPDALGPLSEAELFGRLTELSRDSAPRRFALCAVSPDRQDGGVFGCGVAFDDLAVLIGADGASLGTYRSAETALGILSKLGDLVLVWIDECPEQHDDQPR